MPKYRRLCGTPEERALNLFRVHAHNSTYARHTMRRRLAASLAALQPTFSVFGAKASKRTVSRLPHLGRLANLGQQGSSTFRRVAAGWRPLLADIGSTRLPPRVAQQVGNY